MTLIIQIAKFKFYQYQMRAISPNLKLVKVTRYNYGMRLSIINLILWSLLCPLQYFESDDPDLYTTKVQYIQENDVTDLGLIFAEEEFDSNRGAPTVSSAIRIQ